MSWFNPENFATVDYTQEVERYEVERYVIPQRRNCFKELIKKLKRKIMSWFNSSSFGNIENVFGNSIATGQPLNQSTTISNRPTSTPIIQRVVDDRISLGIAILPPITLTTEVTTPEKEIIKKKYNLNSTMIEYFIKQQKENAELSKKRESAKEEIEKLNQEIKKSVSKIKEVIVITEDQELVQTLEKRIENIKNSPKLEQLEKIVAEIDIKMIKPTKKHTCGICYEAECNCFIKNCGHTFCESCLSKSNKCPVCRKDKQIIKLF
jgi:hypothetical protein